METIWIGTCHCCFDDGSILKYSPSFSQTWRFDPPSQRGSTRVTFRVTWGSTSSSIDLWCDVWLNIRIDILQTYSVLKIPLAACGLENLDGFLSVKLGDNLWYRYNQVHPSSVFSQTTTVDNWMPGSLTCPKTMWFSSLRLLACEAGRTLVRACKV